MEEPMALRWAAASFVETEKSYRRIRLRPALDWPTSDHEVAEMRKALTRSGATTFNCQRDTIERSSGRSTHLAPPRRTWRCNDRKREARAAPSLPRAGDEQGGDRPGSGGQSPYRIPLDRDRSTGPGVGRRACRVRSEMSDAVEAGSVQAVDRHASQGVPEAHGCTALQGRSGPLATRAVTTK